MPRAGSPRKIGLLSRGYLVKSIKNESMMTRKELTIYFESFGTKVCEGTISVHGNGIKSFTPRKNSYVNEKKTLQVV